MDFLKEGRLGTSSNGTKGEMKKKKREEKEERKADSLLRGDNFES